MTSLAEVYDGAGRGDLRRLYLGTGLFVAGALLVVAGIAFFSTGLGGAFGLGVYGSRELAGVAAGLGAPAVFAGVFTVLPASRRERAIGSVGVIVAVFGVVLFVYAYPERWVASGPGHLALPVITVYFLGAALAFWALFAAVVNFKTRNDPGGTVTLRRLIAGEPRRPEGPSPGSGRGNVPGLGGVGILGDVDREPVTTTDDAVVQRTGGGASAPASDGGTQPEELRTPGEDRSAGSDASPAKPTDHYCGNCAHFDYVRTDEGIQPYCGYDEEVMDDMDPCEHWRPNA